jgi:pimeloyl-ACP methyl ester carboxylesterase
MKHLLYQSKKIFYRVEGDGPTVFLVHGFGEDGNVFKEQVEYLRSKFRLIIPDLPGSGRSEMIDDMSIEGLAEVIKKILLAETSPNSADSNRLNKIEDSQNPPHPELGRRTGGRGAFIGHSMGGYIALAFAEKYPESLTGLGLVHSSAFADGEEKKATRRKGIDFIKQNGAFEFLKTAIPNLFSPRSKDEMPEKIDEFIQEQHNFLPEALVSYYEAMMQRPDRTNVLKNSSVPVLFIMGKYDNAIPIEDGMKQCHLPEKSYIHVLRASGHMGMMEEPETSNKALEEFLLQL